MKSLSKILEMLNFSPDGETPTNVPSVPQMRVVSGLAPVDRCPACGSPEVQLEHSFPSEGAFGLFEARDEFWTCRSCGQALRRNAVE